MVVSNEEIEALRKLAQGVSARMVGDAAEDVAQEAVLRAIQNWDRISAYARPWVVRTATNLSVGLLRKQGRIDVGLPTLVSGATQRSDRDTDLMVDLARAIDELPNRQRQAFVLRYRADLDEAAVADLLGCSRGAVKRHLHRAAATLRASTHIDQVSAPRGQKEAPVTTTDSRFSWRDSWVPALEPDGGWPDAPWDHWMIQGPDGSWDRMLVDPSGNPVLDADGDEVMSGPGFDHEIVKIQPGLAEERHLNNPDPRPATADASAGVSTLCDRAAEWGAWFGHPWIGTEHLLMAVAEAEVAGAPDLDRVVAEAARFYEGPNTEARIEVVGARRSGAEFHRPPAESVSWNRALRLVLEATTEPTGVGLFEQLRAERHGIVARLLGST